jgi:hypothetical protein
MDTVLTKILSFLKQQSPIHNKLSIPHFQNQLNKLLLSIWAQGSKRNNFLIKCKLTPAHLRTPDQCKPVTFLHPMRFQQHDLTKSLPRRQMRSLRPRRGTTCSSHQRYG